MYVDLSLSLLPDTCALSGIHVMHIPQNGHPYLHTYVTSAAACGSKRLTTYRLVSQKSPCAADNQAMGQGPRIRSAGVASFSTAKLSISWPSPWPSSSSGSVKFPQIRAPSRKLSPPDDPGREGRQRRRPQSPKKSFRLPAQAAGRVAGPGACGVQAVAGSRRPRGGARGVSPCRLCRLCRLCLLCGARGPALGDLSRALSGAPRTPVAFASGPALVVRCSYHPHVSGHSADMCGMQCTPGEEDEPRPCPSSVVTGRRLRSPSHLGAPQRCTRGRCALHSRLLGSLPAAPSEALASRFPRHGS